MSDKNKDAEKLLFASPEELKKFTTKELKELRDNLDTVITEQDILKAKAPKKLYKITDFKDDIVKPFARESIYTVFNKVNSQDTLMNGEMVRGLFGGKDDQKKNFENKLYGSVYQVESYRIKFSHYELLK